MLEQIPIPFTFLFAALFVLLAIWLGSWLGTRLNIVARESLGTVVGATLGLVAFLLAFTFNMAANRFDDRKELFLEEVNAIGTAYLRAGLLSESRAADTRAKLRTYVDLRIQVLSDPSRLASALAASDRIQDDLWRDVEVRLAERPATILDSLYIQALNQMIDLQQKRVTVGLYSRIPTTIWVGLFVVTGLAMLVVGLLLSQSRLRSGVVSTLVALSFASVITLITDLDRTIEGTMRVDPQPLFDLQDRISASH